MEINARGDPKPYTVKEYFARASDGSPTGRTVFKYDAEGRELERVGYTAEGELVYRMEFFHQLLDTGRELRTVTYSPSGEMWESAICRRDHEDRVVELEWRDAHNSLIERQVYSYLDAPERVHYIRYGKCGDVLEDWVRTT